MIFPIMGDSNTVANGPIIIFIPNEIELLVFSKIKSDIPIISIELPS